MRIQEQGTLAHANGGNSKRTNSCLLYQIKILKSAFKFPFMELCNQIYQFFLKWKNSITGLLTDLAMFDCL